MDKFKENHMKHIIVKLLNINVKWKSSKQPGGWGAHYIQENNTIMVDFSLETVKARRQWNMIFKMPKKRPMSIQILYLVKISFKD